MPALEEIRPGLQRWTALVPDWTPDQGGPEGWAPEVACVAYEGEGALILVDPLIDGDDWGAIDELAERHGGVVDVVTTCPWHSRSAGDAVQRYGNSPGVRSHAHETAIGKGDRVSFEVSHPISGSEAVLPGGIVALLSDVAQGEVTLWIEAVGAVVAGDVLIGAEGARTERLRVCPQAWLGGENAVEDVKEALGPLLDRGVEVVVPLHGAPVLSSAAQALATALEKGPELHSGS